MKGGLSASEQASIRLIIASLLTSGDGSRFVIDRWTDFFEKRNIGPLSTTLVLGFDASDHAPLCWPVAEVPAPRVAAAITLRAALQTKDAVFEIQRRQIYAWLAVIEHYRAGTDAIKAELCHEKLDALIAEQRLSRGDVWRRGFVTAGVDVWQKLFEETPKRYNLNLDGTDKSTKKARPWCFDRFLIDVWALLLKECPTIGALTFFSIKPLDDKGLVKLHFI